MRDNQGGKLRILNDVGNSKSFAGTGDTKQDLFVDAFFEVVGESGDSLRLIPRRFKV